MLQRILVGLDGSKLAEAILPYVGTLARGLRAEVTLLYVADLPEEVVAGEYHRQPAVVERIERARKSAQDYLEGAKRLLGDTGKAAQTATASGDAATQIVYFAESHGFELIALATHGRSGLKRWRFGSVAEKVLHTTRTPLLLVRPGESGATVPEGVEGVHEVVAPLDGSPMAEAALPFAQTVAAAFAVPLTLVRVVQPLYLFGEPAPGSDDDLAASLRASLREYLEQPAGELRRQGAKVNTVVLMGEPAQEIVKYVEAHPGSLTVMATEGRTGLMRMLVGSIAERVAHHVGTPVLLVRPPASPVPLA